MPHTLTLILLLTACVTSADDAQKTPADSADDPSLATSTPTEPVTEPPDTDPSTSSSDTTATTTDTGQPPDTGSPTASAITYGPVVVCPNPEARLTVGPFDHASLPTPDVVPRNLAGSATLVADLRGDAAPELLFGTGDGALIFQRVDDDWVDVTAEALGGLSLSAAWTASAADYDGDGDLDVFIGTLGPNHLLRNDEGVFVDVAPELGLDRTSWHTVSSSWADIDRDGDLDLVVGNYAIGPEGGSVAERFCDPSELYLQEDGVFVDHSAWLPETVHDAYVFMTGWYDLDTDGWTDLITVHDFGGIRNDGTWLRNLEGEGFDGAPMVDHLHGMGLAVADLDDDGGLDLATSSASRIDLRFARPTDTTTVGWEWPIDSAASRGIVLRSSKYFGWGITFGDIDNDGDEDMPAVYGEWDDYPSEEKGGQADSVWMQQADGMFVDHAMEWGVADTGAGRGQVVADLDGDGWLDIVKRQLDGPARIHTARCGDAHWATLRLHDPTGANPDAVGARLLVTSASTHTTRWIDSGSSSMFSGGPPVAHVGLGADEVYDVTVHWPGGEVRRYEALTANREVLLTLQ